MEDGDLEIINNEQERRWEARVNDDVLGYSEYLLPAGRIIFTHTVVEPQHEGKGIGSRIARRALDDAVRRGLRITPRCPFIRSYVRRHPAYLDHVDMPQPTQGQP